MRPVAQPSRAARKLAVMFLAGVAVGMLPRPAPAQQQPQNIIANGFGRAVGGIAIDGGKLIAMETDDLGALQKLRAAAMQDVPRAMQAKAELRKVSLKGLDAAIRGQLAEGKPLSDAMLYLAGLQQVRYVLVYPEQNDIVLAGPGEGWKIDAKGNAVGAVSGRPVMCLDDLLVALRAAHGPQRMVLNCSIDPTPEGVKRLQAFSRRMRPGVPPAVAVQQICEVLGPQKVTIQGVPEDSRFARVLVAADYRMKRISLGLQPSPVQGVTSFLALAGAGSAGMSNMLPRWWLEPNYQPLLKSPDGLAWELRGASVKAMTETDYFDANGIQHPTGGSDEVGRRWAEQFTAHFEALAKAEPVFGELRNCMDLAVVAAVIAKENLADKVHNPLPALLGKDTLSPMRLDAPKEIATKGTLVHKGRKLMVAAGGVQVNPWAMTDKPETGDAPAEVRTRSLALNANWWWD